MTDNNIEGSQGPVSDVTKQVLDDMKAQGYELSNDTTVSEDIDDETIDTDKPKEVEEEKPVETETKEVVEEEEVETKKPEREVSYVPTYKLKVAESQKEKLSKQLEEANAKIEELNKKTNLTSSEKQDLDDSLAQIAEEYQVDPAFLKKLKDAVTPKGFQEKLNELEEERTKIYQEQSFSKEFEKDVTPMLKAENPDISEEALLKIKEDLRPYAFSEDYLKVPLNKIFKAERDGIKIPQATVHKKTVESARSGSTRNVDTIDFDNITEAQLSTLSHDDLLKLAQYKAKKG